MSIELQKALSAAWEKDRALAVCRSRVDDAYELGFIAAWKIAKASANSPEIPVGSSATQQPVVPVSVSLEKCAIAVKRSNPGLFVTEYAAKVAKIVLDEVGVKYRED